MPRTTLNTSVSYPGTSTRTVTRKDDLSKVVTTENMTATSRVESRTTVNTPNFRGKRVKRSGTNREDLPMNPFTYMLRHTDNPYGWSTVEDAYYIDREEGCLHKGCNFEPRGITDSVRTAINTNSLNSSLLDLKDKKIDLGVMFAERKQTADLILSTASRVASGIRSVKRGDLKGALQSLFPDGVPKGAAGRGLKKLASSSKKSGSSAVNSVRNQWLELQYGWKPLLSDVWNSAEALARQSSRPARFRVSSSKSHRWSGPFGAPASDPGQAPVQRTEFGIYTRKYVYVFSYSNEVIHSLSELGLTNPAVIAWELLPLSFVADWFISIGSYLDTLDATLGLTFEKGCVTTFEKCTVRYRASGGVTSASNREDHFWNARKIHVDCNRAALGDFPAPKLPNFDLSFKSKSHVASAAALLHQRFKGIRP